MLPGQFATGFSASTTVTLKEQAFLFPTASIAVQVTVVVPTLKKLPEAGEQETDPPGQLSVKEEE